MKLLNCSNKSCKNCEEATRIGENILGDEMYICANFPQRHKSISAGDCKKFKCADRGEYLIACINCRG